MFRAAHEGRESARAAHAPLLLAADPPANELFAVKNMSPEKMLTISGADRFSRRGGTCRLHAIFMNRSLLHVGFAGGIVKMATQWAGFWRRPQWSSSRRSF